MIKLLVLASMLGTTPAYRADTDTRTVLSEERYRFCHEDDYPLTLEEREFCPLIGEHNEVCPALPAACKSAPRSLAAKEGVPIGPRCDTGSRCLSGRASGKDERIGLGPAPSAGNGKDPEGSPAPSLSPGAKGPDAPDKTTSSPTAAPPPSAPPPILESTPTISAATGALARVVFFILLGVFVVVVVWTLMKNFLADRGEDEPATEDASAPEAPLAKNAPRGPVETDVERLLARARAAAARGDFARAIDDLYAALLRKLDGHGLIHIHPSRTNGDYVRSLRDNPELCSAVKTIATDVERVQFGAKEPSADLYALLESRVVPLVTRALGVLFFVIGLSAALSCAPHVAAGDKDRGGPFRGDASPSGTHAIGKLLESYGRDVAHRSDPLEVLEKGDARTIVLLPDVEMNAARWGRLLDWVEAGGDLVVAGVPSVPARAGATIDPNAMAGGAVEVTRSNRSEIGELALALPAGPRLSLESGGEPLLSRQDGGATYASLQKLGEETSGGHVIVLADDRLFTNLALAAGNNAGFLISLFRALHTRVDVCDAWTGAGAATPIDSLERAHLVPVLLQLLFLLALLYWWRGRAFGTLRDPPTHERRAFADHVRALGLSYARASASRHVLGLYAGWAIERLRERLPREGKRGLSGLSDAIAARTGQPATEVLRVLVDAHEAGREASPISQRAPASQRGGGREKAAAADFALMRELDRFLAATGSDRRKRRRAISRRDS